MNTSNTTTYGVTTSTSFSSDGSSSTTTPSAKYCLRINASALIKGVKDRVTPRPHKFDLVKSGWGSTSQEINRLYGSKVTITTTSGPYMPSNYDQLGLQKTVPDWNRVENRAMAKIYDQLKGNNNLIVDLAEGGQTVKMVKSVLNLKKFIVDFTRNVIKHRKYKRIPKGPDQNQRRLDYVNGKWLEYRYGWTPLIGSIYDAADNLNNYLRKYPILVTGRSGVRVENQAFSLQDTLYSTRFINKYDSSYRVQYGLKFNIPGGPKISDWTSLNPIGIAYELMTLSFVIDWVADIGGYLSLWENNVLYSKHFIGGYKTRSYSENYTEEYHLYRLDPFTYYPDGSREGGFLERNDSTAYSARRGMDRTLVMSLPVPAGITVKVNFGWKHQLDAIALLQGRFSKQLRS